MHATLKVNNIDYNTKRRLLESGLLSETMSDDVAYLRLRFYYQQAPLSWLPLLDEDLIEFRMYDCTAIANKFAAESVVMTPQAICEIVGASLKDVQRIIKDLRLSKLSIPSESILSGLRADFYTSKDMSKVLLRLSNRSYRLHESNRNTARSLVGFNLKHPNGRSGMQQAKNLFDTECQKLLNPSVPVYQLTYETLDYAKLDWKQVCGQPAFKLLRHLYDCPNNEYLSDYLTASDANRTFKLLSELAEKAAKHHRKHTELPEATKTESTFSPPAKSKNEENFKTPSAMMKTMPKPASGFWDIIEVYNAFYTDDPLETLAEFAERGRKFVVDMKQYACQGGDMYLDVKRVYTMHGSSPAFKLEKGFDDLKDYLDDFQISFTTGKQKEYLERQGNSKEVECVLLGSLVYAQHLKVVTADSAIQYFELLCRYIENPKIRPQ